ncbi:nitronate monooxygenase [Actinoallomurus sp. NPDC050550]|uniref:NAD(P)H-dependent flavin oxidoreductase n=1 Tax=Actinoallomurus sp. NPDC050550 TaxID=3154937 RepID=UPI0033CDFCDB
MPLHTALTARLGIDAPVIAAPLGRGSTPRFVTAVADAGAFAFVALMHMPEADIVTTLADYTRVVEPTRFGVNLTLIRDQRRRLAAALDAGIRTVSLWYGDPEPYVEQAKAAGATVFWTVGRLADAARAADLGVDVLVCQGRDAGGHLVGTAGTIALLPAIVDAAGGIPVVAAGGIADGRGLASALIMGAEGVWMGTRFVASEESANHPGYKQRVVDAGFDDLLETRLFDGGWPDSPHRVIRNSTVSRWEEAGCPRSGQRPGEGEVIGAHPNGRSFLRYTDASPWEGFEGDWEAGAHYAGASAPLIHGIEPVARIVASVVEGAELALRRATAATRTVISTPESETR